MFEKVPEEDGVQYMSDPDEDDSANHGKAVHEALKSDVITLQESNRSTLKSLLGGNLNYLALPLSKPVEGPVSQESSVMSSPIKPAYKKVKKMFIDECVNEDGNKGNDEDDDDKSDISNLFDDDNLDEDRDTGMDQYFQYQLSQDSTPNTTPRHGAPLWQLLTAKYGKK